MKTIQPSFAAGELSPGLHGRTDIARYLNALATCRNAVAKPSGAAVKRPGYYYRNEIKDSANECVLLPFVYSTEVRYTIEAGHFYFRFMYLDDNDVAFPLLDAGVPVELATPYADINLGDLRVTQSADVLYIACRGLPPMELHRVSSTEFTLIEHDYRNGPFRPMNDNTRLRAAVSASTGEVSVTVTQAMFTADMVGALFLIEEPELRAIKPWEIASKGVSVGQYCRSDGKVYRCSAVSTGGTYHVNGSVRPIHDSGRAWDGSGDTRNDGVANYTVGVEWEFVHPGYGVVKFTGFVSATEMEGLVITRVPDSCVGTIAPIATWSDVGDGSTKVFPIVGALSSNNRDYAVALDGSGVPSS